MFLVNIIYTALSVLLLAKLLYWQNESIVLLCILMENEILQFALFTFIYHFLKHKVVIFAEVLKHIYLWKS